MHKYSKSSILISNILLVLLFFFGLLYAKPVNAASTWSNWSYWTLKKPSNAGQVETKTQYRYADKITTTSTSSSLSGWIQSGTEAVYGNWGNWYGWVEAQAPGASDTCQVEVSKFWRYYYLKCPVCGSEEGLYRSNHCGQYNLNSSNYVIAWSRTPYSQTGYTLYPQGNWKGVTNSNLLLQENIIGYSGISPGHTWYFNAPDECKQDIGAISGDSNDIIIRAFSRWRTRSKSTQYCFYKWGTWSAWNDKVCTPTASKKVETRTLYRYKNIINYENATRNNFKTSSYSLTSHSAQIHLSPPSGAIGLEVALYDYKWNYIDSKVGDSYVSFTNLKTDTLYYMKARSVIYNSNTVCTWSDARSFAMVTVSVKKKINKKNNSKYVLLKTHKCPGVKKVFMYVSKNSTSSSRKKVLSFPPGKKIQGGLDYYKKPFKRNKKYYLLFTIQLANGLPCDFTYYSYV